MGAQRGALRGSPSDVVDEVELGDDVDKHQLLQINGFDFFGHRAGKASSALGKCSTLTKGFVKRNEAKFKVCGEHTKVYLFDDDKCTASFPMVMGACGTSHLKDYCATLDDKDEHRRWMADIKSFKVVKC